MKPTSTLYFLVLFVMLGVAGSCFWPGTLIAESAEATTVCDIYQHPKKYSGRLVRLEAKYYGGDHGQELVDDKCPRISADGQEIAPGIDITTPIEDQGGKVYLQPTWDRNSWDAFSAFLRKIDHGRPVNVTVIGKIRVKKRFHLRSYGGGLAGNGYGVRGIYRMQIIVHSVEQFEASAEATR